jgi:CheY-like chemotaxis protein
MSEKSRHILVIDDNKDISDVIKMLLDMYGYQTTIRLTGRDALHYVELIKPDVILLDVMLDGFDGRDICNTIKSIDGISHIPVIMISASHKLLDAQQYNCKPDAFVQKPFEIDELMNSIQRFA